jgi:hypothetical protein
MPVWPFVHNWARPVRETLESNTRVITSEDGTEQRAELLDNPRRTLDYNCFLADADARRRCEALLYAHQSDTWDVPIWTDALCLTAPLGIGEGSVPGDFRWRDFDTDGRAMLWRNSRVWEIVELTFVTDTALATSSATKAWRAGDVIVPIRQGRMQEKLSGLRKKRDFLTVTPSFELLGTERSVRRFKPYTAGLYRDWPVLVRPSNTSTALGVTFSDRRITFDPRVGLKFTDSPELASRTEQVFQWTAKGRAQIGDLFDWLRACSGMLRPFWLFSWQNDFAAVLPIGAADTGFDFATFGYGDSYDGSRNRRDVAFRLKNGTMIQRRLEFHSATGDVERCLFDTPLGVEVNSSNLHTVGFLYPVRLATDRIELDWLTSDLVKLATTSTDVFPNLTLPGPTWTGGVSYSVPLNIAFASNALSGLPSGVTYIGTRIYRDTVLLDTVVDDPTETDYTDSDVAFGNTYQYVLVNVFDVDGETVTVSSPTYSWVFILSGS